MTDYKQLSLRDAAKFDHENKLKERITRWGIICKLRQVQKISRKATASVRQANHREKN